MLSSTISQPLEAAITRSCSFRGIDRIGATLGSISERSTFACVDFAAP
jgi:hypothetical protein